ncbi:MAG: dihydroorotase [bacterium]|nr:dihydroorotase [bacterium]
MKLLISNAQVCDLRSPHHGKTCDVWINGELIENIQVSSSKDPSAAPKGYKYIDAKGQTLMPGLFDMRADFCDPGFEHKETLQSGAKTALSGGFTDVALLPSTEPVRDSKIGIEYVRNQSVQLPINLHAYGCLTQQRAGKELAELYDMTLAGAIGFTDGNRPIDNSSLLLRALLYNKIFNGLSLVYPNDVYLSENALMHEGKVSTSLGLKGIPSLSEELMVMRDLELLRYADGKLHFSTLSTKGAVDLVRKAKKQGLAVTADVAFANLCFTDEDLMDYDSNFKLMPPLRSKQDQKALWDGIQDGTLDCIVSNHQPQNKESKEVEFEYAHYGMITLQTILPVLLANKPANIETSAVIGALSFGPRGILGLPENKIEKGSIAQLCLFDPKLNWTFEFNHSKAENTPFLKNKIKGAITHVICKSQLHSH